MRFDRFGSPILPGSIVTYSSTGEGLILAMVDGFVETIPSQARLLVWDRLLKKFRGRYVMVNNMVAVPYVSPSQFLRNSMEAIEL